MTTNYDVAVIGGGLSGTTVAECVVRIAPTAKVLVLERERFHSHVPGCEVCTGANVVVIRTIEDRVDSLRVQGSLPQWSDENGWVSARHFIDASGSSGVIGRFMAAPAFDLGPAPSKVAIWGTRRIAHWPDPLPRCTMKRTARGCLWLISISERLVSLGFVAPADFCEDSELTRAELYCEAISSDAQIEKLVAVSQPEGEIRCSSGLAYIPDRTIGDNWMLVGESAGFADPLETIGMSLAEVSADQVAAVLAASLRGAPNQTGLRRALSESQSQRLAELTRLENSWCAANCNTENILVPVEGRSPFRA